jgi:hypothetical protein
VHRAVARFTGDLRLAQLSLTLPQIVVAQGTSGPIPPPLQGSADSHREKRYTRDFVCR